MSPVKIEGMWRPKHASLADAHKRHKKIFDFSYTGRTKPRTPVEIHLIGNLLWGDVGTQAAMDLGRYNEKGS
ncbi:MAG: hypothetical protein WC880_05355 [Candidatus Paceibacterota bacterium]